MKFYSAIMSAIFVFAAFSVSAQSGGATESQSESKATTSTAPNLAVPADFVSDGCTKFPDGNYIDCCRAHDLEYYYGGSWSQRWKADKRLYQCVAAKPKFYNKIVAPMMWLGVRALGGAWLGTKASWGFGVKGKRKAEKQAAREKKLAEKKAAEKKRK